VVHDGPVSFDLWAEVASIERDELTYRLPNSMCQLMSEEGCDMRLEVARARILLETQQLARRLDVSQIDVLKRELRRAPADEDCRILAIARILAAAGVREHEIESCVPPKAQCRDTLEHAMREGRGIRELG
jgi:hypothetical protein